MPSVIFLRKIVSEISQSKENYKLQLSVLCSYLVTYKIFLKLKNCCVKMCTYTCNFTVCIKYPTVFEIANTELCTKDQPCKRHLIYYIYNFATRQTHGVLLKKSLHATNVSQINGIQSPSLRALCSKLVEYSKALRLGLL